MKNRTYSKNRAFANYGQYAKVTQPVEYVALSNAADLRATEIAELKAKAAATKSAYNKALWENEIERLSR